MDKDLNCSTVGKIYLLANTVSQALRLLLFLDGSMYIYNRYTDIAFMYSIAIYNNIFIIECHILMNFTTDRNIKFNIDLVMKYYYK